MKFKKLAALTLAGAMSLSLAACGGGGGDTASPCLLYTSDAADD